MKKFTLTALSLALVSTVSAANLPTGFVYLHDIDPTIIQEMRYAGYHNFLGRPITGYNAPTCILTLQAAEALHKVQMDLLKSNLSLKVYDCYRPQRAVDDFVASHNDLKDQRMKAEFYPRVSKSDFFSLGYVAEKSGHTRGSTIDLTIVPVPTPKQAAYHPGQKLYDCTLPYGKRFRDNSIEMGTGFDCFDEKAHAYSQSVNAVAYHNRSMFRAVMGKYGFVPYVNEWWHFTFRDEPFPRTYFDFPVQ